MKSVIRLVCILIFVILLFFIYGCGGGGGSALTGTLLATINWPSRGRIIPKLTSSIKINISNNGYNLSEIINRPASGGNSNITITNVPVGNVTVNITAYDMINATGTILAKALSNVNVYTNQETPLIIDMNSVIAFVILSGYTSTTLTVGTTITLNASFQDVNGHIVPSMAIINWNSNNNSIATVNNGIVRTFSPGTVTIKATETESNISGYIIFNIQNATPSTLGPNQKLLAGQYLESSNGNSRLYMQYDGNLVLYHLYGSVMMAKWSSETTGIAGAYAEMQASDGNFVIYDNQGNPRWSTYTIGASNSVIVIQDDGNLVIYDPSWNVKWATYSFYEPGLGPGQKLFVNQSITSHNGKAILYMQVDGNLVLYFIYGSQWVAKWATGTAGTTGTVAIMQYDGNFVLYDQQGLCIWNSQTNGANDSYLVLQDDGNLVLYNNQDNAIWSTNTFINPPPTPITSPALDDFIKKYSGQRIGFHGSYVGECVSLAKTWEEANGWNIITGNAINEQGPQPGYDWIVNTPSGIPSPGDLVIFDYSRYGHISIFISGDTNSFQSFDQNYPSGSPCQIVTHYYNHVIGWQHWKY